MENTSIERLAPEAEAPFDCRRAAEAAYDVIASSRMLLEQAHHTLARADAVIRRSDMRLIRGLRR